MAKAEINKETTVIKFTEEEIGKVQSFKEQFSEVVARLGEVEIELTLINSQIEQIENYKTQVEILKSMIDDRDKLISLYEKQLLIQDKHIESINNDIDKLKLL